MNPNEERRPEHPDDPNDDPLTPADAGGIDKEVNEAHIPVHGDEKLADDLVKKAYGDKDQDGRGDAPNAPFPG